MSTNDADTSHAFILSAVDFERLEAMAAEHTVSGAARTLLRAKLELSTVLFGSDIPADIVTIGSQVQITRGANAPLEVIVGTDPRMPPPAGLSVLDLNTSLAIALLGCKAGMSVISPRSDGFVETVRIDSVRAQPEAVSATNVVRFAPRRAVPAPAPEQPDDPGPSAA